jgi:hypothetical protein
VNRHLGIETRWQISASVGGSTVDTVRIDDLIACNCCLTKLA